VRAEFERSTGGKPYVPPIPDHIDPTQYEPEEN
jgi:hypothetical protein